MAASLIEPGGDRPEQKDQKFTGLEFFKDVQLSDAKRALFRKGFCMRSDQCSVSKGATFWESCFRQSRCDVKVLLLKSCFHQWSFGLAIL